MIAMRFHRYRTDFLSKNTAGLVLVHTNKDTCVYLVYRPSHSAIPDGHLWIWSAPQGQGAQLGRNRYNFDKIPTAQLMTMF